MSKGIGAHANLVLEDEHTVVYEYGGYNLNDPVYRNADHVFDGLIVVEKACFVEPEIHEKIRKMSSGRKRRVIKKIPRSVDYEGLLRKGSIKVENCSNCWRLSDDDLQIDVMALMLLFRLFREYQEIGAVPSTISYNV